MRLALFKVRLAVLLSFFVFQVVFTNARQLKTLFAASMITLVVLLAAAANMQLARATALQQQITSITLSVPGTKKVTATRDEVEKLIVEYNSLLEKQPQHRDVLLNLALLYSALDNPEAAQQKWDQARALDPNHPAFTQ